MTVEQDATLPKRWHQQHFVLLLWLAGGTALALQVWGLWDLRHDDAFITYRYGQNLASGHGLVFNPGERVLGTTAPGHALLAALSYLIVGKQGLPSVMAILGCLGWMLQGVALGLLLRRPLGAFGSLVIAASVMAGASGAGAWVALETNLAMAATLWTLGAVQARRWNAGAALAGLAFVLRPDSFLVVPFVAFSCWRQERWRLWKPALVFLAVAAPWVLFAFSYYGSPLPQTALAKVGRTPFDAYSTHLLAHLGEHLFASGSPLVLAIAWLAAAAGAVLLIRVQRSLWVLVAYGLAHVLAYLSIRPFVQHIWHLYPAVTVFVVLGLSSFSLAASWTSRRSVAFVARAALVVLAALYFARTFSYARGAPSAYWNGARDAAYRQASRYLNQHATRGERVMALEVGTIGYWTELPMHDLGGLVTRDAGKLPRDLRWQVVDPHSKPLPGGRPVALFKGSAFRVVVLDLAPFWRRLGGAR